MVAGGMLGLNPDEVRGMASQFDTNASQIDTIIGTLNGLISQHISANWNGPDADQFANDWNSSLVTQLNTVKQALTDAANVARTNADAQEDVSRH